jgi:protein-tyrosine-phosphatase
MYPSANIYSTGTEPAAGVNTRAVGVMAEKGTGVSAHEAEHLVNDITSKRGPPTNVVTVRGGAKENCPLLNKVETHKATRIVHVASTTRPLPFKALPTRRIFSTRPRRDRDLHIRLARNPPSARVQVVARYVTVEELQIATTQQTYFCTAPQSSKQPS